MHFCARFKCILSTNAAKSIHVVVIKLLQFTLSKKSWGFYILAAYFHVEICGNCIVLSTHFGCYSEVFPTSEVNCKIPRPFVPLLDA